MDLEKPIFILGPYRSGTTILYNLFASHKDLAYYEHYGNKFFKQPEKFKFIPLLLKYQRLRYGIKRPRVSEGEPWKRFYHHLKEIDESHVTDEVKNYYYSTMKAEIKAFHAKRFVHKSPKNCIRIRWLNEMFPKAFYIYIKREPKPIVSSYRFKIEKEIEFKNRNRPNQTDNAWEEIVAKFENNTTLLETCAIHYKYLMKFLQRDLPLIKERTMEVDYKEFVKNPRDELKRLYNFVGLSWYKELEKVIPEHLELKNNEKWKTLEPKEVEFLKKEFPDEISF